MQEFFCAPLQRDYFDSWLKRLSIAFDIKLSPERCDLIFGALQDVKFTNAEIGLAGDWIVSHNDRFPAIAHFIGCQALGRNFSKS